MRKGSALLIVLGMLSFMVVSAVGFSIYMRQSRLPSSFLRRTSASRHLAKAALAEAIDQIDRAIGSNPYPGLGHETTSDSLGQRGHANFFQDRVFIGSTNVLQYLDAGQTISTLTLEGLAYIPPPFVTAARYWGRRAQTAKWQTLSYDAGRFAYTAIDVSDCFDVNRLYAESPRSSAADSRISLAYLFRTASGGNGETSDGKWSTGDLTAWDSFIAQRGEQGDVPLVSLADLNLALYGLGNSLFFKSPWAQYVENGGDTFYVGSGSVVSSAEAKKYAREEFVTDSWFPSFVGSNATTGASLDIADGRNQPFFGLNTDSKTANDASVEDLMRLNNTFLSKYVDQIQMAECVCLYDYLDLDPIPTSLALPTAEMAPMVVGVDANPMNAPLKFDVKADLDQTTPLQQPPATKQGQTWSRPVEFYAYLTDSAGAGADFLKPSVAAGFAYPFKYKHASSASFKAQVAVKLFWIDAGADLDKLMRPSSAPGSLSMPTGNWSPGATISGAAMTYVSQEKQVNVNQVPAQISDILCQDISEQLDRAQAAWFGKGQQYIVHCTFNQNFQWQADPNNANGGEYVPANPKFTVAGTPDSTMKVIQSGNNGFTEVNLPLNGTAFRLCAAVYVRIRNGSDTVDLVPAAASDDKVPLTQNVPRCMQGRPLLLFPLTADATQNQTLSVTMAADSCTVGSGLTFPTVAAGGNVPSGGAVSGAPTYTRTILLADDPRWNFAPENFWSKGAITQSDIAHEWLNEATYGVNKAYGDCDPDPYMNVSDQGYLQSIYELAFIPRASGLNKQCAPGDPTWGQCDSGAYNGVLRTQKADLCAYANMWRTYSFFDPDGIDRQDMRTAKMNVVNGGSGFVVNPYTPSTNVMMAALGHTPLDWWAAGTNRTENGWGTSGTPNMSMALGYTIGPYGNDFNCNWTDLWGLGAKFVRLFRTGQEDEGTTGVTDNRINVPNWENVYDDMDWYLKKGDDPSKFMDVDLGADLDSIDRKYLHAFWKQCLGNRQQLFLVFVRAEPSMLGSGAVGQMPPQLGARAVALVWRDPIGSLLNRNLPHQTRILFYRQLD